MYSNQYRDIVNGGLNIFLVCRSIFRTDNIFCSFVFFIFITGICSTHSFVHQTSWDSISHTPRTRLESRVCNKGYRLKIHCAFGRYEDGVWWHLVENTVKIALMNGKNTVKINHIGNWTKNDEKSYIRLSFVYIFMLYTRNNNVEPLIIAVSIEEYWF